MKKNDFIKRMAIVLVVVALPALGWLVAQQGGGPDSAEQSDMTNLPQTQQEKIEFFQEYREECLQHGNMAAVSYCDWALSFLEE